MASAYIRSKGAGYENVYQLFGGIQRYLEHFPDGGFFKGKNFVFDHRISVGSSDADIVGLCLLCGSSFDDYSSRCRCTYCRMLVLVCGSCQGKDSAVYVCELCRKYGKGGFPVPLMENSNFQSKSRPDGSRAIEFESATDNATSSPELPWRHGSIPPRKLRILCLHGFRQNASNFKGRTASLAKKLRNIAEFIFVDAPHELPFIYQQSPPKPNHTEQSPEQTSDFSNTSQHNLPPQENCKKRFAWLVAPEFNCSLGHTWKMADVPFDLLQYQQQTGGSEESHSYLKTVLSQMGPFDGVLGFSQGAAMTTLLCSRRGSDDGNIDFRFAILCSGFPLIMEEFNRGPICCPSLHIFGNGEGKDRQIGHHVSMELAGLFDRDSSVVIEHESGHIIPTQSPYIDQVKAFLHRFV